MGGCVPDAPASTESWRWCTALSMAFIRRHPEHIEELKDCYVKGLEWVHPAILEQARKQLPPLNPYYALDPNLVKTGKWKESVSNSFDLGGYQNFLPSSLKEDRAAFDRELQEAREREQIEESKKNEKKEHIEVGLHPKDEKKMRAKYRAEKKKNESFDLARTRKFDTIEQKRQPLLNVEYKRLAKLNDFKELKKRWESTCTLSDEMKRLKLEEKKKNARKPFDSSTQAIDYSMSKRMELGFHGKKSFDGPSPLAKEALEAANQVSEHLAQAIEYTCPLLPLTLNYSPLNDIHRPPKMFSLACSFWILDSIWALLLALLTLLAQQLLQRKQKRQKPLTALEQALANVDKSSKWKFQAADQEKTLKQNLDKCQVRRMTKKKCRGTR